MAKCKKGTIWDSESGECRVPTKDEKMEMAQWKDAKSAAGKYGTVTGMLKGGLIGMLSTDPRVKLATTVAGALYGRHKAIKKQKEESTPPYTNVKSRKITKKKRK